MFTSVSDWLDDFSVGTAIWYIKRLSGNDTLANGSHQAGPYLTQGALFHLFPRMRGQTDANQECWIDCHIESHGENREVRVVWYNNKYRGGTRNESRITNFGGQDSAMLDPENTGAVVVFAFLQGRFGERKICRVWIARDLEEEEAIEDRVGFVAPGETRIMHPAAIDPIISPDREGSCWLSPEKIPAEWLDDFPTGAEIISKAIELRPAMDIDPDQRIIRRRKCESDLFFSLEEAVELEMIQTGYETMELFVNKAQSILQRRKSRAGRSLELHARAIFMEEGLQEDQDFSYQKTTEGRKQPDFLFPSAQNYHNDRFPDNRLRMLGVKTTCKDRWRQVLNEADRIETKHLLTLQEGISENQFKEMQEYGVQLVVPSPIIRSYREDIRAHIKTLESFIREIKQLKGE